MNNIPKEVTFRGLLIGSLGSVIITASSVYVALKLGALPWPTIFVTVLSMAILKAMGNTNAKEINVTHTTMSAGAMVGGGLAFTLPAIWIIQDAEFVFWDVLIITLCGTLLGLSCTTLIRRYFIEIKKDEFTYPIGLAAYETIKVSETTDKNTFYLFSTLGLSAIFTVLRDKVGLIPQLFSTQRLSRVGFSAWVSPMAVAIGYIIGPLFSGIWALGALIGYFLLVPLGISTGLFADAALANAFRSNLGIGLMVGTGIGVLLRGILPKIPELLGGFFTTRRSSLRWPILIKLIAIFALLIFGTSFRSLGIFSIVIVLLIIVGTWLSATSAAVLTGQTGVNPMEVLGILVLLAVKLIIPESTYLLILSATVAAVAAGLTGDIMNDYRVGHLVSTRPASQRIGETLGAIIGVVTSVSVMMLLVKNYGVDSFGKPEGFPAPQAQAVAAMAGQISHISAFWIGLVAGCILWLIKLPSMTLGLGVYLPVFITMPVFLGGLVCFIESRFGGKKRIGTIVASGVLGGEAVMGVILAILGLTQSIIP